MDTFHGSRSIKHFIFYFKMCIFYYYRPMCRKKCTNICWFLCIVIFGVIDEKLHRVYNRSDLFVTWWCCRLQQQAVYQISSWPNTYEKAVCRRFLEMRIISVLETAVLQVTVFYFAKCWCWKITSLFLMALFCCYIASKLNCVVNTNVTVCFRR